MYGTSHQRVVPDLCMATCDHKETHTLTVIYNGRQFGAAAFDGTTLMDWPASWNSRKIFVLKAV